MTPEEVAIRDIHRTLPSRGGSEDIAFLLDLIDQLRGRQAEIWNEGAEAMHAEARDPDGPGWPDNPYVRLTP